MGEKDFDATIRQISELFGSRYHAYRAKGSSAGVTMPNGRGSTPVSAHSLPTVHHQHRKHCERRGARVEVHASRDPDGHERCARDRAKERSARCACRIAIGGRNSA